jgi:hypothetical protein
VIGCDFLFCEGARLGASLSRKLVRVASMNHETPGMVQQNGLTEYIAMARRIPGAVLQGCGDGGPCGGKNSRHLCLRDVEETLDDRGVKLGVTREDETPDGFFLWKALTIWP